jgi:hypothetical protein
MPIWVEYLGGGQGSGTGFIFVSQVHDSQSIPFFVTNLHVVNNAKRGLIEFARRENDNPVRGKRIRVEVDGNLLVNFVDTKNDLAIIPIAPVLNQLEESGQQIFFRSISPDLIPDPSVLEQLGAVEEITFIGYPSGLYDETNVTPIVRRGITATPIWNDFQDRPAFLIDAGVFPGSSGSPVFLFNQGGYGASGGFVIGNRLFFLGVLSEAIIRKESINTDVFLGLGKVIKSQLLHQFVNNVIRKLTEKETE